MNTGEIDKSLLRDAFQRSGLSKSELCRRLGWATLARNRADTSRLDRALGLVQRSRSDAARYDTALAIVQGCGFDPVDYGL